jgi:hypothetical protein
MSDLKNRLEAISAAFARLNQREQVFVLGGAVGGILFILLLIGTLVGSAIGRAETRVKQQTDALAQVMLLQGEYKAKQNAQKEVLAQLSRSQVPLIKQVEDAARAAGIDKDVGKMQKNDGDPNAEGVKELRVEVAASNLSIDRLQDFLTRLQQSAGVVIVDKLKINKPFRKETLDVELTVMTFQVSQS